MPTTLASIAAVRGTEPAKLTKLVRGELDWIVMKALEKDRNRRYETANGLAMDVQRYLADEPVLASPPSAVYRVRKFVRRNKGRLAVAGVLAAALLVAIGGIGWSVRDRVARREKAADDFEVAIERVELFQQQGTRAEALAAFERAELSAGEASPDAAREARLAGLKEKLEADARDREFIARFEEIRLWAQSEVNLQASEFRDLAALPEIRGALRHFGVEIGITTPDQAAARIQGRPEPVRRQLIAALDEWLRYAPEEDSQTRQWLRLTVNAADRGAWRVQVRKAIASGEWKTVEQLARDVDLRKQPPSFLLQAALNLPAPMKVARLDLLRRIQRTYPADLWANHQLADALTHSGQPAEAVRYYTAALALRPENPGILINRGNALVHANEVDAAIADYRQAIALAPDYPMAHYNLGGALKAKGLMDDAIACYREAIRLRRDFSEAHTNLGSAVQAKGLIEDAIAEHREAIRLKKDFAEAHNNLGLALAAKGLIDDAIAEHREAIRLDKDNAPAHNNLGSALQAKGLIDDAIAKHREAIRLDKDNATAHTSLGVALLAKGLIDDAIGEHREAIRLKKDFAVAHFNLAVALADKGLIDDAIACYRNAVRLRKDYSEAHTNLGFALADKGLIDDAISCYREAIRLDKDNALARNNLGLALQAKGLIDDAIAEHREAIRLKKNNAVAHNNLGIAVAKKGLIDDAIAEFEEAIRLKNDYAEPHCNLGHALRQQGKFHEALQELRRGHQLGSKTPRWRYPSAQWVRQCERLVELDQRLPAILDRKAAPASPSERLELAWLCLLKHLNRAAASFYEQAFAADPKLADDPRASCRYDAACAAALAGCGRGEDAGTLNDAERSGLRRQALDWLQADLKAKHLLLTEDSQKATTTIRQAMQHWQSDPDLAGVRGPEALAKLPDDERQAWQKLWDDVAKLVAQLQPPTEKCAVSDPTPDPDTR